MSGAGVSVSRVAAEMVRATQGYSRRADWAAERLASRLADVQALPVERAPIPWRIVIGRLWELIGENRRRRDCDLPHAAAILVFDRRRRLVAEYRGYNGCGGTHAERAALERHEPAPDGEIAVVVVARRTPIGVSRPCPACLAEIRFLKNSYKDVWVVWHLAGRIWAEKI